MPDNHTTPDVYRHNSVTTMCDDICTILTGNGATITEHEECGYPLEGFCEICIDDYGICRPEHIVSTVINHFNLNS